MAHHKYGRRETLKDWAHGRSGRHVHSRLQQWPAHIRARVLALNLLSPVLMIRHPDFVARFVHGSRLEYTNRQPYAQKLPLAVT